MVSPRRHTIVLVTYESVARVDLQSSKSVETVRSWHVPRPEHGELGSAVRTALELGPAKPESVYVLCDEFWSGNVTLANEIAHAVTEDELEQTLLLRAEQDSGISPFESRLGFARPISSNGHTSWRVTQAETAQLNAIEAAAGASSAMVVAISSISSPELDPATTTSAVLDVASQGSVEAFARDWLTRYLDDARELPVVMLSSQCGSRRPRIGYLALGVVCLVCVALHLLGNRQIALAETELSRVAVREQQLRTEIEERREATRRAQVAQQEHEAAERARRQHLQELHRKQIEHSALRRRPVQLLRAIAATTAPGHWVQRIQWSGERATITGVACESDSVTRLAERLESELAPEKWLVEAAELSASDSLQLVHFEITVLPVGEAVLPLSVARSGVADAR